MKASEGWRKELEFIARTVVENGVEVTHYTQRVGPVSGATNCTSVEGNAALMVEAAADSTATAPTANGERVIEFEQVDLCVGRRLGLDGNRATAGEIMGKVRGFDVDHKRYKNLLYLGVWALLRDAGAKEQREIHASLRDDGVIPEGEDVSYMRQLAEAAREIVSWEEESGVSLSRLPLTFLRNWLGFRRNVTWLASEQERREKLECLDRVKRAVIAGHERPVAYMREEIKRFRETVARDRIPVPTGERVALNDWVTAVNADCMSLGCSIVEESFHLLISDPPYGMEFESEGRIRGGMPGYGSEAEFLELCRTWAREWMRWLVPGGLVMAFQASKRPDILVYALREAGFKILEPLVWDTHYPHNPGGSARLSDLGTAEGPLSNLELVVLARKPKTKMYKKANRRQAEEKGIDSGFKALTDADAERWRAKGVEITAHANGAIGTLIGCDRPNGGGHGGGALMAKPVALIEFLMEWSNVGMGPIIDPFMGGSGASLIAAFKSGKNLRGYERDPKRFASAVARAREACPIDPWAEDER